MQTGNCTEHGVAPIWHTDLLACFTTQLINKWRGTVRQDTHRYLLCGTRPSDLRGKDLITQEFPNRQELVHLARARCGESELWARLYWAVRECTHQRCFCNTSPAQSAYMRSTNDPTAPGTDTVPPTACNEDASPVERRPNKRRRKEKCPYCDSTLTGFSNLIIHCRSFHPEHPPPLPKLNAISATWSSPHGEAPRNTGIDAHITPTPTDIETAVPGGDHCYRRISQLPQACQLARNKPCIICF
ncbi:hypothetical protein MOQ_006883 [Trypanosoma cruzi marinkellei]|uniref:C2H2-type domain-containing protein n=1 Tax=Trypanosoma cruzi marinkellei TaxID=85056 RepID=K2MQG9_TRYCR|nr:hypothetical protein MOQ_006883 [Trypanosoma cruzi marinkellei]